MRGGEKGVSSSINIDKWHGINSMETVHDLHEASPDIRMSFELLFLYSDTSTNMKEKINQK